MANDALSIVSQAPAYVRASALCVASAFRDALVLLYSEALVMPGFLQA